MDEAQHSSLHRFCVVTLMVVQALQSYEILDLRYV
jgi:hypothetical protein